MKLDGIISAMMRIETKGESTLILADCIRALASLSEEIKTKEQEENDETVHDSE